MGSTRRAREAFAAMSNGEELTLELRSGERLSGVFCGFVDDEALLSTLRGSRRVPARQVEKILLTLSVQAPE